jgi:hypothetical protein
MRKSPASGPARGVMEAPREARPRDRDTRVALYPTFGRSFSAFKIAASGYS